MELLRLGKRSWELNPRLDDCHNKSVKAEGGGMLSKNGGGRDDVRRQTDVTCSIRVSSMLHITYPASHVDP